MTKGEQECIRNIIARLKKPRLGAAKGYCEFNDEYEAKIYINTWIIGSLECLLPEERDVDLAVRLSK